MQKAILLDLSEIKTKGIDILKTAIDTGWTIQICVFIPDYKQLLVIAYKA
jgi:hypothetical protein